MLTVVIITRNEEDVITDCIESVKNFATEVLVIDGKSTDKTAQIAIKLGAKVVVNPFEDFASQRMLALKHISNDWFLYLDSDERATQEFRDEVEKTIQSFKKDNGVGGYYIRRKTYYFNRDWGLIDRMQRLFHKDYFEKWEGVVHETPRIRGNFGEISSPILHFTHRNLSQMLEKTNAWSEYEAKLRYDSNHPQMTTLRFARVIITGFLQSYIRDNGYKNGTFGLIEALYQSYSLFITYAKLWEMQNKKEKAKV
jgi:(heptosyl)LPS beta-1,4-glucosyltransferase